MPRLAMRIVRPGAIEAPEESEADWTGPADVVVLHLEDRWSDPEVIGRHRCESVDAAAELLLHLCRDLPRAAGARPGPTV